MTTGIPYVNLIHCISSGFEIAEANKKFNDNQRLETRIQETRADRKWRCDSRKSWWIRFTR